MNATPLPDFQPGTVPQAADFAALVDAVRALLQASDILPPQRRTTPRRHIFTPAGSARFTLDDAGQPQALLAEYLWQVGPEVHRLSGGNISGLGEALQGLNNAPVGLHADIPYTLQGSIEGATLRPASISWSLAPWVEPEDLPDGSLSGTAHGTSLVASFMPELSIRHQRQRAYAMHPLPQRPALVWRSWDFPAIQGCAALLPAPDFSQVLAASYGGHYDSRGDFIHQSHLWLARLDTWGQLHFSTSSRP